MVMMKYKILSDFIFILLMMASYCHADDSKQMLDVKKHLKSVNKFPLKSIKSPDGDIIDCVDIYKQPAFDHPSLKNHTIQMRPNSRPEEQSLLSDMSFLKSKKNYPKTITQLWHNSGSCPKGTIPIRRTKEEDVLRAPSIKSYGKKNIRNIINPEATNNDGHEYAIAYAKGEYFGLNATFNIWKPEIQDPHEFSASGMWVTNGPDSSLNSVEAGWLVSHETFGDELPRLFTYWTGDGYINTGCYNLVCPGFVQTSNKVALGNSLNPISGYQSSQFELFVEIWKDFKSGNWWLYFGNETVGYWPGSLFPNLETASTIQWGGEVFNSKSDGQHTTTQMGSGHFPDEGFGKASFIRNVEPFFSNRRYYPYNVKLFAAQPKCYNIQRRKWSKNWGSFFYYGGPGRNPECP